MPADRNSQKLYRGGWMVENQAHFWEIVQVMLEFTPRKADPDTLPSFAFASLRRSGTRLMDGGNLCCLSAAAVWVSLPAGEETS